MKKITGIFFVLALCAASLYTLHATTIMGFNVTGAPGESTCAGCHIGTINPDNFGSINIWVNGDNRNTTFMPDSTYEIEVISAHPGTTKFGFALAARYKGVEFVSVGTFLSAGEPGMFISDYVTHDSTGTIGNTLRKWKFKWKAPKNPAGNTIMLYTAGVMANNDNNTQGDKVYTDSLTLTLASTGINTVSAKQELQVYHTTQGWRLHSFFPLNELKVYTLEGREIAVNLMDNASNNSYTISTEQLQSGVYLVSVRTEKGNWVQKVLKP